MSRGGPVGAAHIAMSLPLTPVSSHDSTPVQSSHPAEMQRADIPLLSTLFSAQAEEIGESSVALEIVTPPSHILDGFVHDTTRTSSPDAYVSARVALVRLPPPHASSNRPERLGATFSDVLRPHDAARLASSSGFGTALSSSTTATSRLSGALDIRESLTALLDLAGESLEASQLVLILDRTEWDEVGMQELLHSLMYAGGVVLRPQPAYAQGGLNGWQWDATRWVLVGLEV